MTGDRPVDIVSLGQSDLRISVVGLGTWAWGDRMVWQYGGGGFNDEDIAAAYDTSLQAGINFLDTAEVYGFGKSEDFIGGFRARSDPPPFIASKFFPWPWRWRERDVLRAVKGSLRRLGMSSLDLYQVHWPFPPAWNDKRVRGLALAVESGLARTVGVSNFDLGQCRQAQRTLHELGIPLASNQVQFSLVNRKAETSGLLAFCRDHGITLIAYSPLGKGTLTGKYGLDVLPPGTRSRTYDQGFFRKVQPLLALMAEISAARAKTLAQIALNWTICKGAVPIPGAKNARQAGENAGAMGWRLSSQEVEALDLASTPFLHD